MEPITSDLLLRAYGEGLFPMAPDEQSDELEWFCPQERGIIPLEAPALPRRLMRTVMAGQYRLCSDEDFDGMMQACARLTPSRPETWISGRIRQLYGELHRLGHAHSVEVRDRESGALLGGLYGVSLHGAFFGESMVSHVRDASKIALVHLMAALRQGGYGLLDTQYVTPHLASLGCVGVPFAAYRQQLAAAMQQPARWPGDVSLAALGPELEAMVQGSAGRAER
ncbi:MULTISPECIES: leucyl/phenylalanyl-tRNA--protein transferase [Acetobacteraceae]|uniref:Leucyl/phenylalanyl-tRNA--protein transferase n=1 Tax=Parasaccharibacter apium TaxID=1510841 RepID=A0ABX4ZP00_9PROT|nr:MULTISPECIES: leucyl/phenylalanyl-tRNA--protein transferase [Acetobacteraceae]MCL1562213.1 leucyl/phenylalanyl-tRNA--protein transferase [Parasaccharibacter sp. TMW 2.1886]MCQ0041710.1 leucyl/phenylalanyl-tRNA--protein transferase [Bombella sp.]QGT74729.1 leucyl/phenylalanyl-tRNA--protein transferase [Bombella sp. ESL0368]MCL1510902.1 leucyl/phenylalanyl-tRNA--protein transferase [Parasaccharibacter sp. TMW 2.1884]MCL1514499.1 leucyl/phenylalanyl-tRNA--protein transferase [Parasaccharibacte